MAPWNLPDITANIKESERQRELRIKELELELAAWKQAHANLLESVERERKAHNVQVASFNRHFASLDFFKVRAFDSSGHDMPSELNGVYRTKALLSSVSLTATRTCSRNPCSYRDRREDGRLPNRSQRRSRNTLPTRTSKSSADSRFGSLFTTTGGTSWNYSMTTTCVRLSSSRPSSPGSAKPPRGLRWSTLASTRAPQSLKS